MASLREFNARMMSRGIIKATQGIELCFHCNQLINPDMVIRDSIQDAEVPFCCEHCRSIGKQQFEGRLSE
ncbi:MAG: putative metal-binding domain of cation transport ATPase [Firmicutes bacterium]|nr:putative metal-binding domain of cation transport ATPase [Bacillota bacterium]